MSSWLQNGFHRFLERYLAKNFDAVGIEASSLDLLEQIRAGEPLIIYANHPSWWDPMIAHFLNRRLFPVRQFYAPIDAQALQRYQVLKRLGFYGVELGSMSGVRTFLQTSDRIATAGNTAIWITPEGQFTDPRDHDGGWQPGLAHLCNRLSWSRCPNRLGVLFLGRATSSLPDLGGSSNLHHITTRTFKRDAKQAIDRPTPIHTK